MTIQRLLTARWPGVLVYIYIYSGSMHKVISVYISAPQMNFTGHKVVIYEGASPDE